MTATMTMTLDELLTTETLLRVERYVRSRCLGNVDADTVYSNTLLRLYQAHDKFQGDRQSFLRWAFRMAHLCWLDELRTVTNGTSSRGDTTLRNDEVVSSVGVEDTGFQELDGEMFVSELLARLPSRERACFLLHLDGYSSKDAAEVLQLKPATARKLLQRARERLQVEAGDLLREQLPTPGAGRR